jgi:3-deoxy-manno-octulosonate cytidylyltransferase (CMP-KDO synthetase)
MRSTTALSAEERLSRFTYLKHQGIYGYWRETLVRFVQLPVGRLETMESLEQLRAMENRIPIFVLPVTDESMGVDTPEDLKRVEQVLMNQHI